MAAKARGFAAVQGGSDAGPTVRLALVGAIGAGLFAALLAMLGLAQPWGALAAFAAAACGCVAIWALGGRSDPPPSAVAPPDPPTRAAQTLAQLAPLLEALPDPALLVDAEGRIAGSNAAARGQLQFEASGLRLSSIIRNPELLDAAQAAAHDLASRTVEYATLGPVDEHFKAYVAPVVFQGAPAALMVVHDQTTLIATERMRADFLANASHELRTPLAALSLLIETLAGPARDDPEAQTRFLALMQSQADRMSRLVADLLSLSRIELNEHVPPTGEVDLSAIAREAIDAVAPLAKNRDVSVVFNGPPLPVTVVGERFQLAQVGQNLIDNAIKYSPTGGVVSVEVGVAADREDAAAKSSRQWAQAGRITLLTPPPGALRGYGYLRVSDSGAGIARRHLPRLAERFYRVERDEGSEKTGTGLGLAIVKHIISRHRGGFAVESVVGQGAAFAVFVEQAATPAASPGAGVHGLVTKSP